MGRWLAVASAAAVLGAMSSTNSFIQFPGGQAAVLSHRRSAWLEFRRSPRSCKDCAYALFVHRRGKPPRLLLQFDRWADAIWSPDDKYLAINDYEGSDTSNCLVFEVDRNLRPTDVRKAVLTRPTRLKSYEHPNLAHFYVSCGAISASNHIRGTVAGHTDSNPVKVFRHLFDLDAATGRLSWLGERRGHDK